MANIEDGLVYEYIENLYDDIEEKDGGSYPTKQDPIVFSKAAEHFSITIEEAEEIYHRVSKSIADKEMKKLDKLPPALRQKILKRRASDILKNNKDLPYHQIEGPPVEELPKGLQTVFDEYLPLSKAIGENGWTIPLSMSMTSLDVLKGNEPLTIEQLDEFFLDYYTVKRFKLLIKHISNSDIPEANKELFNECLATYKDEMYRICSNSLISLFEGVLSTFGDDPKDIRMMRICRFHADENKKANRLIKSVIWESYYKFVRILFEKSKFDENEPDKLNRHWILHGRSNRDVRKSDCLRLFSGIHTLITLKKYSI